MQQRGYYAIIPAIVRYNKKLTGNAKLLYGEITALTNEKGFCWATNQYFAELYGVSNKSISLWIKQLKEEKLITTKLNYKENSKEIANRFIWLLPLPMDGEFYENFPTPMENNFPTSPQKGNDPMEENVKENNTFNNTINNYIYKDDFELIWKSYPKKTLKQKAYQQFMKKVTDDKSLAQFRKGFSDYLEYIKLNSDWYSPAELFRWIRDERYNDEYDLTPKKQFGKRNQYKRRVEPKQLSKPPVRELPSDEEISRMIREREENEQL